MKCYYYETNSEFVLCAEDIKNARLENLIEFTSWEKSDDKLILMFSQNEIDSRDKELVGKNFARLGQAMLESRLSSCDWEKALELLAQNFNENGIEWYIIGSLCDAIRGAAVKPGDIDIVIQILVLIKIPCGQFQIGAAELPDIPFGDEGDSPDQGRPFTQLNDRHRFLMADL